MKFCNEGRCKFGKSSNQPLLFFLLILSSERMVNKTNCDMYLDVSSDLVMKRFSTLPIQAISFEKGKPVPCPCKVSTCPNRPKREA